MTVVKIAACRRGDLPFLVKTMAAVKAAMRGDAVGGRHNARWIDWIEGPRGAASFTLAAMPKAPDDHEKRIAPGKALLADAGLLPAK